ncbi:hypothetical protein [Segatella hominis]|jgi:hypothetical protein|uniref:hypothetical protein n=1 Tax=Segatella hominis TaxID=2518605 RepID=UPI0021C5FF71|nr:hypothetical protein [Segatella hominis]
MEMEEMVGCLSFIFYFIFVPLSAMRNNSRCPRRISYWINFETKKKKVSKKFGSMDVFLYFCGMLNK